MPSRALLLLVVLSTGTLTACQKKCDSSNCAAGCCDASGACVTPSANACGTAGAQCVGCFLGQVCQVGACVPGAGTGGSSGGLGGGSGGGTGGGAGGGTGGFGGGGSDALNGYRAVAASYCGWYARCGSLSPSQVTDCTAYFLASFVGSANSEAQLHNYSLPGADACARAFDSLACGGSTPTECNGVPYGAGGAVTTGGACIASSSECASINDVCGGATCPRTCQPSPQGGNGQPCRRSGTTTCDSGLFCNDQTICEAKRLAGAVCAPYWGQCQSGLCENQLCVALPAAGAACRSAYPRCGPGTWCSSNVCTASKASGQSCIGYTDECLAPLQCISGSCATPAGVGAPCKGFSSCQSNLTCDQILRTCQERLPVQTGGQCSNDARYCASPSVCLGERTNPDGGVGQLGSCAIPQLGGMCSSTGECPNRSFCDATSHCVTSTTGSACSYSSSHCSTSDYCGSTNTCAPRFATAAQCDSTELDSCLVPTDRCVIGATDPALRCRPVASVGGACGQDDGCAPLLRCIQNVCSQVGHIGQACSSLGCLEGACSDGGCIAPQPVGQPCRGYTECASGVCINDTCRATACP